MKVIARAATRVDLAGGTIDIWPLSQLLKKATVNISVGAIAECTCQPLESSDFVISSLDQNTKLIGSFKELSESLELALPAQFLKALWKPEWQALSISTNAKSPKGAGLGGSSSLAVAIVSAICALREELYSVLAPKDSSIVQIAADLEAKLIHAPTGIQDYWAAVRGGANIIEYPLGGLHYNHRKGIIDHTS